METPIKVLVVDDHTLFAEGTVSLLSAETGIEVVGIASNSEECLKLVKSTYPHTVLLDINLPDSCGVDLINKINEENSDTAIIMLTGQSPEGYFKASLAQGARGFLLKDCTKDEMVTAIRKTARGDTYYSQSIYSYLESAKNVKQNNNISKLTSRELEVLKLVSEGLRNIDIAERLSITKRTIEYHVGNILTKLEVKSRLAAVLLYKENIV